MATDEHGRRITVDEGKLHVTSVFQRTGDHAVLDHQADLDEEVLVALGYKQEFKRYLVLGASTKALSDYGLQRLFDLGILLGVLLSSRAPTVNCLDFEL